MPAETEEDRLAFLHTAEFGLQVEVRPPVDPPFTISAQFDDQHLLLDQLSESGVSTSDPRILCRSSDVAAVQQDWIVVIAGREFEVTDVQPDGTGMTMLELHRV